MSPGVPCSVATPWVGRARIFRHNSGSMEEMEHLSGLPARAGPVRFWQPIVHSRVTRLDRTPVQIARRLMAWPVPKPLKRSGAQHREAVLAIVAEGSLS